MTDFCNDYVVTVVAYTQSYLIISRDEINGMALCYQQDLTEEIAGEFWLQFFWSKNCV
jgi:hypothetical protein